ncbi:hypothetical protein HS088_TW11G00415 [Tripterygium wilfordii]|uniref:Uncharacterized protein n=1 Tax=Tripterygium wilfordii TaxID=458696 RepID=A0A7J7D244_TRIWF|nr:hypothetical protein HS088_TW11G00415 [Tripterygium wilfordii]
MALKLLLLLVATLLLVSTKAFPFFPSNDEEYSTQALTVSPSVPVPVPAPAPAVPVKAPTPAPLVKPSPPPPAAPKVPTPSPPIVFLCVERGAKHTRGRMYAKELARLAVFDANACLRELTATERCVELATLP